MFQFLWTVFQLSAITVLSLGLMTVPAQADSSEQLTAGIEKLYQGNYQAASSLFDEVLRKDSDSLKAKQLRCFAHLNLEEYESAIADCSDVIAEKSELLEAYLWRGLAYYRSHNYQEAIKNYNQILNRNPEHPQALYNRGLAWSAVNQFPAAIADYNQALGYHNLLSDEEKAMIYNDRGIAYLQQQQYEQAREDFLQAIALDQNDSRSLYNLGCVCHYLGEHKTAIKHFTQSIQKAPNNPSAYISRGLAFHQLDYTQSAIEDLKTGANLLKAQGNLQGEQEIRNLIWQLRQARTSTLNYV